MHLGRALVKCHSLIDSRRFQQLPDLARPSLAWARNGHVIPFCITSVVGDSCGRSGRCSGPRSMQHTFDRQTDGIPRERRVFDKKAQRRAPGHGRGRRHRTEDLAPPHRHKDAHVGRSSLSFLTGKQKRPCRRRRARMKQVAKRCPAQGYGANVIFILAGPSYLARAQRAQRIPLFLAMHVFNFNEINACNGSHAPASLHPPTATATHCPNLSAGLRSLLMYCAFFWDAGAETC